MMDDYEDEFICPGCALSLEQIKEGHRPAGKTPLHVQFTDTEAQAMLYFHPKRDRHYHDHILIYGCDEPTVIPVGVMPSAPRLSPVAGHLLDEISVSGYTLRAIYNPQDDAISCYYIELRDEHGCLAREKVYGDGPLSVNYNISMTVRPPGSKKPIRLNETVTVPPYFGRDQIMYIALIQAGFKMELVQGPNLVRDRWGEEAPETVAAAMPMAPDVGKRRYPEIGASGIMA